MKIAAGNPLLSELRQMAATAANQPLKTNMNATANSTNAVAGGNQGFGQVISKALDMVNQQQMQSNDLQHRVEMGDKSVTLVQAMIAGQKAGVAFQATVQVRNRLVSAYQEIMNMPI